MKKFKLVVSAVLAVFLCITVAPAAFAMGANENVGEQIVTFSDFTQLAENECLEKSGIERVADGRSVYKTGSTWRVWFTGVTINAEFYMSVSNDAVTSVYDESISVIGGTYEDDELTMTSTYGKLSFKVTSLGSILSGKCWLKGTVTGSENKINVTWRM